MFKDLFSLFFPKPCCGCGQSLIKNEEVFCTTCISVLPKTGFYSENDLQIKNIFKGRITLNQASSFLYFEKDGLVQQLLHRFKYKGFKEVGNKIGALYGEELKKNSELMKADYLIPVPLYKNKERKRGYNQSLIFAEGISSAIGIKVDKNSLLKIRKTSSQTRLERWIRWMNQQEVFDLKNKNIFENKHIVIVDDVITTGATLEACVNLFSDIQDCKVSVLTMAVAGF